MKDHYLVDKTDSEWGSCCHVDQLAHMISEYYTDCLRPSENKRPDRRMEALKELQKIAKVHPENFSNNTVGSLILVMDGPPFFALEAITALTTVLNEIKPNIRKRFVFPLDCHKIMKAARVRERKPGVFEWGYDPESSDASRLFSALIRLIPEDVRGEAMLLDERDTIANEYLHARKRLNDDVLKRKMPTRVRKLIAGIQAAWRNTCD